MSEEEKVDTTNTQAAEDNSPTLEEKIDAQLAAMHDNAAPEEKEDEQKEDEQEVVDTETDDDEDTEAAESDDDSPILPAGHRRAALADGWTSEEVDYYLETQPEEAAARFESLYKDWREENSQWSRRGRQLRAADQAEDVVDSSTKSNELPEQLEKFDTKALIDEHGNDELITALTTPLNKVIDQVNSVLGKVSESQAFVRESTDETIEKIVEDFLSSKDMDAFQEMYGKDAGNLTEEQLDSRMELFSEADDIVLGAKGHGKKITVVNALRRAHNNVSESSKDAAVRQTIRKELKGRTKTLSNSKQKTTSPKSDTPLTREELVARTNARLQVMHSK